MEEYYTEEELAKELGVTKKTLQNMRASRRPTPPYVKFCGDTFYLRQDVLKFLKDQRVLPREYREY